MAVQKPLSAFVELCWWPLVIFVYYLFTFSIFVDVSPDLGVGVHPPLGPLLYLMKSWARLEDLSPQLSACLVFLLPNSENPTLNHEKHHTSG